MPPTPSPAPLPAQDPELWGWFPAGPMLPQFPSPHLGKAREGGGGFRHVPKPAQEGTGPPPPKPARAARACVCPPIPAQLPPPKQGKGPTGAPGPPSSLPRETRGDNPAGSIPHQRKAPLLPSPPLSHPPPPGLTLKTQIHKRHPPPPPVPPKSPPSSPGSSLRAAEALASVRRCEGREGARPGAPWSKPPSGTARAAGLRRFPPNPAARRLDADLGIPAK